MSRDLSLVSLEELRAQFPSFVQPIPGQEPSADPLQSYDCWCIKRHGNVVVDYAQGREHFDAALATARYFDSPSMLWYALAGMMKAGVIDAVEVGFVDALASKAAAGAVRRVQTKWADVAPEVVADAELTAELEIQNSRGDPVSLFCSIGDILAGPTRAAGDLVRLMVFCGAALNGARH